MDPSGKYLALDIEPRFGIEISALEPLFWDRWPNYKKADLHFTTCA
jgi:hypothetical protein